MNEIIESPTESTTINSLPLPSISLIKLSPANDESVDTSDSPENPVSFSNSPHASIQVKEAARSPHSRDPFDDRERTENRYRKAIKWLEESLKLRRTNWEPFVIPDFTDISEKDSLLQLRREAGPWFEGIRYNRESSSLTFFVFFVVSGRLSRRLQSRKVSSEKVALPLK